MISREVKFFLKYANRKQLFVDMLAQRVVTVAWNGSCRYTVTDHDPPSSNQALGFLTPANSGGYM
jgi:hypothetical protein